MVGYLFDVWPAAANRQHNILIVSLGGTLDEEKQGSEEKLPAGKPEELGGHGTVTNQQFEPIEERLINNGNKFLDDPKVTVGRGEF